MSEKVVLKKDVADAIERYLKAFGKQALVSGFLEVDGEEVSWSGEYVSLYEIDFDKLLSAIVNGYTIEQTPEEKVREYYYLQSAEWLHGIYDVDNFAQAEAPEAIRQTLSLLGIKIEGINA